MFSAAPFGCGDEGPGHWLPLRAALRLLSIAAQRSVDQRRHRCQIVAVLEDLILDRLIRRRAIAEIQGCIANSDIMFVVDDLVKETKESSCL